jgi:hypothetical protein
MVSDLPSSKFKNIIESLPKGLMAEEQNLGVGNLSDQSLRPQIPAIPPLLLDEESPTEDSFENQALEDMQRYQRAAAARTVYHQRRADDDTL